MKKILCSLVILLGISTTAWANPVVIGDTKGWEITKNLDDKVAGESYCSAQKEFKGATGEKSLKVAKFASDGTYMLSILNPSWKFKTTGEKLSTEIWFDEGTHQTITAKTGQNIKESQLYFGVDESTLRGMVTSDKISVSPAGQKVFSWFDLDGFADAYVDVESCVSKLLAK